MVGGVRSALIVAVGLAACGPATTSSDTRVTAPRPVIGDAEWPFVEKLPDAPGAADPYAPAATLVMAQFGPPSGAKGSGHLAVLDALAETADLDSEVAFDGDAMVAKLEAASAKYTALIAEPGFAAYAKADEVLFRAARIRFEVNDYDAGATLVTRMLSEYPRSRWIGEAYLLIGNAAADRDPAVARRFYDEAIAIAKGPVRDYARYQRLHVLDELDDFQGALDDAKQLASSNAALREVVGVAVVHAFAMIGDPSDAPAVFGAIDRDHLPTLLRYVSDRYKSLGKLDAARAVLADVVAVSTDPLEICEAHARLLVVLDLLAEHTDVVREARLLADVAEHTTEPSCRISIDMALGAQAWKSNNAIELADLRDANELWRLAISAATSPERKAVELRDRAYLLWRIARELHDREGWAAAAAAFEAAFAATHDPELDAGAALARSNAREMSHRR